MRMLEREEVVVVRRRVVVAVVVVIVAAVVVRLIRTIQVYAAYYHDQRCELRPIRPEHD